MFNFNSKILVLNTQLFVFNFYLSEFLFKFNLKSILTFPPKIIFLELRLHFLDFLL